MRILVVGNFDFDSSYANALRVHGLVDALVLGGHEVSVLSNRRSLEFSDPALIPRTLVASVDEYKDGLLSSLPPGMRGLLIGDVSAAFVRAESQKPDCIILHGAHLGYLLRFRRLCRDLRIPLVLDIVEWYQPEDLPGGRFGPYAVANEFSMRYSSLAADGFIVLSRRLEDHYSVGGKPVINVPPLFTPERSVSRKASETDGRLHLCYAGTPGRKEAFDLILATLQQVADQGVEITLHAVGMTAAELAAVPGAANYKFCEPSSERIQFYGRIPNCQARRIVAQSDFTLLLRPLRKANQFGFPSKLAESMAVGTPVIANQFSDLGLHLVDGQNAILLKHLSLEASVEAFRRAAAMAPIRRRRIAQHALRTARNRFSPVTVAGPLSHFLESMP